MPVLSKLPLKGASKVGNARERVFSTLCVENFDITKCHLLLFPYKRIEYMCTLRLLP